MHAARREPVHTCIRIRAPRGSPHLYSPSHYSLISSLRPRGGSCARAIIAIVQKCPFSLHPIGAECGGGAPSKGGSILSRRAYFSRAPATLTCTFVAHCRLPFLKTRSCEAMLFSLPVVRSNATCVARPMATRALFCSNCLLFPFALC